MPPITQIAMGWRDSEPSLTASQWLGPVNAELNLAWEHAIGDIEGEPDNTLQYNFAVIYPVRRVFLVLGGGRQLQVHVLDRRYSGDDENDQQHKRQVQQRSDVQLVERAVMAFGEFSHRLLT